MDHRASIALLALLGLGACVNPQPVAPTVGCDFTAMLAQQRQGLPLAIVPPVAGTMTEIPLNSVSMTDPAITNKVLVQSTSAGRSPTGTLQTATRLVNCTDFPLQVEGRTHFFDQAQAAVEPVSAWKRVFLPARSIGSYEESSTDARRAAAYLVELREGR